MNRVTLASLEEVIEALQKFVREHPGTVLNPCDMIPCMGYSAYTPEGELTLFECPIESLKSIPHDSPLRIALATEQGRLNLGDAIAYVN